MHNNKTDRNLNTKRSAVTIALALLLALGMVLSIAHIVFFGRGWQLKSLGGSGSKVQYAQVMDYLEGKGPLPEEMTQPEKSHMADVKSVVDKGKIIELCAWIVGRKRFRIGRLSPRRTDWRERF